jgi:hypothetical protein
MFVSSGSNCCGMTFAAFWLSSCWFSFCRSAGINCTLVLFFSALDVEVLKIILVRRAHVHEIAMVAFSIKLLEIAGIAYRGFFLLVEVNKSSLEKLKIGKAGLKL